MNKDYKSINNLWKDSEGYRYFGTLKLSSKIKYDGDDFIPLWEWINQLQQENKKQKEVIDKAIKYIECNKYTIKHYEPYGTPTGLSNYETYNIKGYHQLLDILKEVSE